MSIRKWWFVPGVIAAVMLQIIARGDAVTDARKAIQALYDSANAAITKRDATGAFAIYSPTFIAINNKGEKHTLADMRQRLQLLSDQSKTIVGTTKIQTLTLKGNTANVRIIEHSKLIGVDPATGTDSTLVMDSTSDDIWVLTKGRWLETKSKTLTTKDTLNGRPFE